MDISEKGSYCPHDFSEHTDGYTGDTCCLGCGDKLQSGSTIPATHTHDWDHWVFNRDGTHTRTCKTNSSHTETGSCEKYNWHYGAAIHTKTWECEMCGGGRDKISEDNYEHVYANDTDLTCDYCGYDMSQPLLQRYFPRGQDGRFRNDHHQLLRRCDWENLQ